MQQVFFRDLGKMDYQSAWDLQESLLKENVALKSASWNAAANGSVTGNGHATGNVNGDTAGNVNAAGNGNDHVAGNGSAAGNSHVTGNANGDAAGNVNAAGNGNGHTAANVSTADTRHHLLLVEHPPVYTLGKSGHEEHVLMSSEEMQQKGLSFFRTNRGGDITYHGPGQVVGYPILDLEKFYTDIGKYLRSLEEVIILTIAEYGLRGERSAGETGVWLDPSARGRERKICAMGVRCSRWVTMHGFALNVNTDLAYFGNIIPCGIPDKQVTSLEKELGRPVPMEEVKAKLKANFEKVFEVELIS